MPQLSQHLITPCEEEMLLRSAAWNRTLNHDLHASQLPEEQEEFGLEPDHILLNDATMLEIWDAKTEHGSLAHRLVAIEVAPFRCNHTESCMLIEAKLERARLDPYAVGHFEDALESDALAVVRTRSRMRRQILRRREGPLSARR